MQTIKFSFPYPKLYGPEGCPVGQCRLLQVLPVQIEDLAAEFLHYDTAAGTYPLPPSGKYLLLIFMKPDRVNLFTTIRRHTPEKEAYYGRLIGEVFNIQLNTP